MIQSKNLLWIFSFHRIYGLLLPFEILHFIWHDDGFGEVVYYYFFSICRVQTSQTICYL